MADNIDLNSTLTASSDPTYSIKQSTLDNIADAINEKAGTIGGMTPVEMPTAINNITRILPEVIITTEPQAVLIVKKGALEHQYSVGDEGTITIEIPEFGIWEITAKKDSDIQVTNINIDTVKQYTLSMPLYPIYGVEWSRTSSSSWSRTDAAALFTDPVPYVAGMSVGDYGSPFDNIMPWAGMVRVSDDDAGELVCIPKFYYKWDNSNDKMKLQISKSHQTGFLCSPAHLDRGDGKGERDVVYVGRYHCASTTYKSETGKWPQMSITRATARSAIHNLGQDIWQLDHAMWWTISMLYLVEFANANCQGTIGYGKGSSVKNTGYTDSMPYHTGTMIASKTQYDVSIQYRNIEGLWANVGQWCDGIYFSGVNIYHILNPSQFSDTVNGTFTGIRATRNAAVIKGFTFPDIKDYEWAGYPGNGDVGSTGTTGVDYFCDNYYYSNAANVLIVGTYFYDLQGFGLFYLYGYDSDSSTGNKVGARLQKLP